MCDNSVLIESYLGTCMSDELDVLRTKIDQIDQNLLQHLAERQKVVQQIGKLKAERKMPPLQPARWQAVLDKNCATGAALDLDKQYVTDIWQRIHQESLALEAKEISHEEQR